MLGRRLLLTVLVAAMASLGVGSVAGGPSVAVVGLAVVVVLGGRWEKQRVGAILWAAVAGLAHVSAVLARAWMSGSGVSVAEAVTLLLGVPFGLMLLSRETHEMMQRFSRALSTSEVARAKLTRSNKEYRRAMARTEDALSRMSAIVDNLADGMVVVGTDERIELATPVLAEILGRDEVPARALCREVLPMELQGVLATSLHENRVVSEEFALGTGRVGLAVASPVQVKENTVAVVALVRDITLAKELDRMKSDFVATVSHEMRTPLTSVLGFTRIVEGQLDKRIWRHVPPEDEKASKAQQAIRQNLAIVLQEGQRLTALIDDVLDMSKLEAGQMALNTEEVQPDELVAEAVSATVGLLAEREAVRLVVEVEPELVPVVADRHRVHQVLVNLIGNAVKFTEEGRITIEVRRDQTEVRFGVRDTGVGIAANEVGSVFEKFRQVGDTLTDRPRGAGLGLPICRELVRLHGGRIWVESVLGTGSIFCFTLPVVAGYDSPTEGAA